jgi:Zn-dependent protease
VGPPVFVVSVVVHECAHGLIALANGDPTARDHGRFSLDPRRHLDLVGSLLVPGLLLSFGSPYVVGWAKPIPTDHARLKDPRNGAAIVALAGPAANILLAIAFAGLARIAPPGPSGDLLRAAGYTGVLWNCALTAFNLLPIPPLDGSWILSRFLRLRHILALHHFRIPIAVVLVLLILAPTPSRRLLLAPVDAGVRACCAMVGLPAPEPHR